MKYILFTTTTCPKCPAMKEFVAAEIEFEGEQVNNESSNFMEKAQEFGVDAAPTLIIFNDEDKEIFRGNEVQEIKDFLAS
ncbi:thioredoxin family protein [Candidatus Gracilibacteria bacterium]|nr:thioredoxin family protein [Candidatus Gracilibacteria bacterium]MCF7856221.1 thioredoxin family protein [Candidatus Gracilibacteria bacterium]MCF7896714.1 thioredoxin family protein [Candidatus Gracilibacteria bacterium]